MNGLRLAACIIYTVQCIHHQLALGGSRGFLCASGKRDKKITLHLFHLPSSVWNRCSCGVLLVSLLHCLSVLHNIFREVWDGLDVLVCKGESESASD